MKNAINKIIFFAAVFFAAGLSNISANAAGAISGGFSTGSTNFIIGVAVGYAENGTDPLTSVNRGANVDASAACINYPANSCSIITDFANQYLAMYVDLSDIANIETRSGRGMNAADAQAAARENCADSTKCDCVVLARDITENAIQMTVAYSFTAADAENTTVCDTIIEPDVCDGTTATVNEARTACECATGFPIMETGGLSCRAIESAADCPGEFFNNAVSPARCEPITNCDTATTRLNPDTNMCEPTTPPTCEEHETINSSNMCVDRAAMDCGNGEVFSPVNSGGICQTPATFFAANTITVAARYSAESCESAGWISSITINSEKTEVAEVCGIPVVRNDSATAAIASAAESAPLQFPENENANECIIRKSAGFDAAENMPDCDDENLFGESGGFPQMPENFNLATDRLIIVVVADGRNRIFFNDNEIRIAVAPPRNNDAEVAIIGAVGVAMAMYAIADFLHDGRPADAFAFSSDFGYRISENDYFVQAGGKIEYAVNENLRMQWSAGQTNSGGDFGDFRYLSKAEYKTDLFAAEFSESVAGETANYNFSLSADVDGRLVDFSPVYRLHSEYDKGEFSTRNELNLQGNFRYNGWTINPSAGFRWENTNDFAENARFQINAIHRF